MAASFEGFESLVEHGPDAISLVDCQGDILYGSHSAAKMFGYQAEELVGRNCIDLLPPEDRDHSRLALREVVANPPGDMQWNARVRHKNGKYSWVESTVSNLLQQAEVRALVMRQRDIQERRAEDLEKERKAEELVRSNTRLEEFAYTAAHDLLEPLRAIRAHTELLIQEIPLDENTRQISKFIVDGAARMSILIEDLLSFAATGIQEPPQRVELRSAVEQAMENLAVDIETSSASIFVEPLPAVYGVQIHLMRLFQNVIGNAVNIAGNPRRRFL